LDLFVKILISENICLYVRPTIKRLLGQLRLDELNDFLFKFQIYKYTTMIRIQGLIPLAESCLDPQKENPSEGEIEALIAGLRKVLAGGLQKGPMDRVSPLQPRRRQRAPDRRKNRRSPHAEKQRSCFNLAFPVYRGWVRGKWQQPAGFDNLAWLAGSCAFT
jgi:hypothetical protein